ncbi:MAG: FeoB-associated Cys-rich membrane protein, partial [Oscillospiraceae bacterium]|nr:FeoB-associated Cys-rich membrane protein [Oscillospiraceae bacterium]
MATVIISIILAAVVALIIFNMYRKKKQGKG